ncbi:MAG: tetratricopeptide repeat protein [candidate division Zixibacteria bacterium]|nr:tetratricopeptide repeat protein [candidate division Zixibacteria bacterium]
MPKKIQQNEERAPRPANLPDDFVYIRHLGSGGTASVALIESKTTRRKYAFKYSHSPEANFSDLITREIQITSELDFPGVVTPQPIDEKDFGKGIILPFLPGISLDEIKRIESPLALMNLISSLSITLYYLKLRGVTHGDIKPHNIILPENLSDKDIETVGLFYPHLIDFSMAQLTGESANNRIGVGTLGFSAPETTTSRAVSHLSDIFSLGVIAYQLATGEHPFINEESDPARIAAAVREDDPAEISDVVSSFPKSFSELIRELIAKEPILRPANGFIICERLAEIGATFPFRKAIQPKRMTPRDPRIDLDTFLELAGLALPESERLKLISGGNLQKVRLILSKNFASGALNWINGELRGCSDFETYEWPRQLIEAERIRFRSLATSSKKDVIRAAVVGGLANLRRIRFIKRETLPGPEIDSALVELVAPVVSDAIVKRIAFRTAASIDTTELNSTGLELCANLYLKASVLNRSTELIIRYCNQLSPEGREVEALPVLSNATKLAEENQDTLRLAELLHRDGDIRKGVGDMIGAEARYLRIISLDDDQIPKSTLAESYKDLGDIYKMKQDFDSGLKALEQASKLYQELDNQTELARVTNNIGNIHWIVSDFSSALITYRKALTLHKKRGDIADTASTINNIGSVFAITGNLKRATRLYKIALTLKRKLNDKIEIARTLNNIGYTYHKQGETSLALDCLNEALQLNRELGNRKEVMFNLDNLVACALTAGRLHESLVRSMEGRTLAEELSDDANKAIFDLNIATVFKRTGQWKKTDKLIRNSLQTSRRLQDKTLQVLALLQETDFLNKVCRPDLASESAHEALSAAREIGDKSGEIQALIIGPSLGDKDFSEALRIAEELKSNREIALVKLAWAESLLSKDRPEDAVKLLGAPTEFFENSLEDIERPRFFRILAEVTLALEPNSPETKRHIVTGLRQAEINGDKSELWKLETVMGELLLDAGEFQAGYKHLARALQKVKEISGELPRREYLRPFLTQPLVKRLNESIQHLRLKLTVKR